MQESRSKSQIGKLCALFGKSRQAYYDRIRFNIERTKSHEIVLELISVIRREIPRIGTKKLFRMIKKTLEKQGIKIGRDAVHDLLIDHGLTVRPKRRYVITTNSNHWMKKWPNLIKDLKVLEPELVWVSDITYIQVCDDFNFLNLITDAYSKRIMGYCLHDSLAAQGTLTALKMALNNRTHDQLNLIHHSDRGTQYCCSDYVELLQNAGISISMTENGDPYENPIAERVNGILKGDFDLKRVFANRLDALTAVDKCITAYNELRPHMSCNYHTPAEAHQMAGEFKETWKRKEFHKTQITNEV
jgi:transposase InsO family protein